MLCLSERGAEGWALKGLSIKVDSGFEPRTMVWPFPYTSIGGQIEAAPLRKLLKLVLKHD